MIRILMLLAILFGCQNKEHVMPKEELLSIVHNSDDQWYVLNFWSTTCKPCIREMHQFTELHAQYPEIEIILIGLDGIEEKDKYQKFIKKHKITRLARLLDAPVYHEWMDQVDPDYWGTMPATLIINNARQQRVFLNRELDEGELSLIIKQMLRLNQ